MTGATTSGSDATAGNKEHAERAALPDYATAEALGQNPEQLYPDVATHLASCASCRDELDELLALVVPAFTGQIPPAPAYPKPNLSFLKKTEPSAAQPPETSWIDDAGRLWIRFSQSLLDALRAPSLAGAMRGQLLVRYVQTSDSPEELEVTIEVFAADKGDDLATVCVAVDRLDRSPDQQAGSQVILHAGTMLLQGQTTETGDIEFKAIPRALLPELEVEVVTAGS